jgi:hypothetical protein
LIDELEQGPVREVLIGGNVVWCGVSEVQNDSLPLPEDLLRYKPVT